MFSSCTATWKLLRVLHAEFCAATSDIGMLELDLLITIAKELDTHSFHYVFRFCEYKECIYDGLMYSGYSFKMDGRRKYLFYREE